jgi:hypothetical protein
MAVAAESPPMKANSQRGLPVVDREAEHEEVALERLLPERQQPGEGDREDEEVDPQQVQREQPHRLADVILRDVLDDGDVELARQEHHRRRAEDRDRRPGEETGRGWAAQDE